jgi:hypothetical protein
MGGLVMKAGEKNGWTVAIEHLPDHRVEADEHWAAHTKLGDLGLRPSTCLKRC